MNNKNQIIPLGEENLKTFGFTDEQIIISSKKHSTFDSLMNSVQKSGMFETIKTIPVKSIEEICYNENDSRFTIRHEKNGKSNVELILLANVYLRESLVSQIAELKNYKKEVVSESKTKPLILNLIGVIAIPIATWISRSMAIDAQNGEHYVASGRNSGLKQLLASVIEAIGPTGITIIGVIALIYMIYVTHRRYNNPASEVLFK